MSYSPLEILLDTTYLLPILGVDIPGIGEVLEAVEKLHEQDKAILFYSPFSLLEAIGKIAKMPHDVDRVRDGLSAIIESGVFRMALPSLDGYVGALIGRAKGFRDLIDLLLYMTARDNGIRFLTRDEKLIEFIKSVGEDTSVFLSEEELKSIK